MKKEFEHPRPSGKPNASNYLASTLTVMVVLYFPGNPPARRRNFFFFDILLAPSPMLCSFFPGRLSTLVYTAHVASYFYSKSVAAAKNKRKGTFVVVWIEERGHGNKKKERKTGRRPSYFQDTASIKLHCIELYTFRYCRTCYTEVGSRVTPACHSRAAEDFQMSLFYLPIFPSLS
jgi:hypothetical protein